MNKKPELKTFAVPMRLTVLVDIIVTAETTEEAYSKCAENNWEDDTWADRCIFEDWEVTGSPKEK